MPIKIQCDECGSSRRVNDRLAGRRVRCPDCEATLRVPALAPPEPITPDGDAKGVPETASAPVPATPVADEPEHWPLSEADGDASALAPPSMIDEDEPSFAPEVAAVAGVGVAHGETSAPPHSVAAHNVAAQSITSQHAADQGGAAAPVIFDDDDDKVDEVLQRAKKPEEEMDMTPMVDVTFLLLIFFMVTASFALQRSIEMPEQLTEAPSTSNQEEQDEVEMVDLEIDRDGMFRVITDATEHQPTPSKMAMLVSLKEANTSKGDPMKLNVKVHEDAEVRFLVYGMDAGNQANYSPIIVTQVDGFDE